MHMYETEQHFTVQSSVCACQTNCYMAPVCVGSIEEKNSLAADGAFFGFLTCSLKSEQNTAPCSLKETQLFSVNIK